MFKKQTFLPLALFLFFCTLFTVAMPLTAVSKEQDGKKTTVASTVNAQTTINELQVDKTPKTTTITLVATASIPDYTVKKLAGTDGSSPRMYIDIENVDAGKLPQSQNIDTSVSEIRTSPRGTGVRIVFNSASPDLFGYTVQPVAQGLQVTINETTTATSSGDTTLDALINSTAEISTEPGMAQSSLATTKPSSVASTFAGFNREHISVDFYKIDLHNVFRLLREISGQNIIVDESVSGSLTLALTDVPWDFALDVILNLKGLEKEEQFNTIVIYPKNKTFEWPAEAAGSLTIEEAPIILAQEELIIEKASQQPEEVLLAKEIITKARRAEKAENFNKATELYIQAFALWPQNAQIATRIATLYLVNLGMNAKATFYAKEALSADPSNIRAALYAAIGSANMGRTEEAGEYFRQSISGTPPLREALVSFAAFSENNGNNKAALVLLKKLHSNYGETMSSMISTARLYDKMGQYGKATEQYSAILASGFQVRPNLREYINERVQSGLQ